MRAHAQAKAEQKVRLEAERAEREERKRRQEDLRQADTAEGHTLASELPHPWLAGVVSNYRAITKIVP